MLMLDCGSAGFSDGIVGATQCAVYEITTYGFGPFSVALVGLLLAVAAIRHARKLVRGA